MARVNRNSRPGNTGDSQWRIDYPTTRAAVFPIHIAMNRNRLLRFPLLLILGVALSTTRLPSQQSQSNTANANGVPVHMVVTLEAKKGKEPPMLQPDDVMVYQGKDRNKVTEWRSLRGTP